MAIIGPDRQVTPSQLLEGGKEFYRRIKEGGYSLQEILGNASREMRDATLIYEPITGFIYEAWITQLIVKTRPDEQLARRERIRRKMINLRKFEPNEIEETISKLPILAPPAALQTLWDTMFMLDLFPENAKRFGLDLAAIHAMLVGETKTIQGTDA